MSKTSRNGLVKSAYQIVTALIPAGLFMKSWPHRPKTKELNAIKLTILIYFAPGENPTEEVLKSIEESAVSSIGFNEHQRTSAIHVILTTFIF